MTPLLKPDGGIQPIAVSTIWRCLVSKVAIRGVGKDMAKYLNDFQFGIHNIKRCRGCFAQFQHSTKSALLQEVRVRCPSISLWVEFLYGQTTILYLEDEHIMAATRVQQGDMLGALLLALMLHPLIHKIRDNCKLLHHAWYLDDGTIIGDSEEVAKPLDMIRETSPGLGLHLNIIRKTEIFCPSCDEIKLHIRGCSLHTLGGRCRGMCQSIYMEEIAVLFDKELRAAVENIVDMEFDFAVTIRQKAIFGCLKAAHAQDFLLAIPIDGLGQHMSLVEYCTILRCAGISVEKEAPVNFLIDP
ncbi:hypothetical protein A2U01_0001207 [Trifolium medium]|uniref:Reverse transcriptase domain-containing protein n=1 Tax=Trifolium medium TaxID=97028 RepID=A0A392LZL2_9FABA|nr:hypothetical protein [Trifolium medium]